MQVNAIANCPAPDGRCSQTPAYIAPTPSNPTAVSCGLGPATGETTGSGYPILFPLTSPAGQTLTDNSAVDGTSGLQFPTKTTYAVGTVAAFTAVSLIDFNNFRGAVKQTIDILDQKIRDIISIQAQSCP